MPIFLPKMVDNFGLMEGLVVFSVFSKLFSNFAQIFYVLILRTYRKMVLMELWKNITFKSFGPTVQQTIVVTMRMPSAVRRIKL